VVHAERRRGKPRTRILYWFRTPPGVKVGRSALDEDARRHIEALNPGIEFDWPRILKGQGTPPSEPRPPAEVRRRPGEQRGLPSARKEARPVPRSAPASRQEPERIAGSPPDVAASPQATSKSPDVIPHATAAPTAVDESTPAHARLGAPGVQRLRARYADIIARISEQQADPARQEELKQSAERLNPDSWITPDQVVQALEQYEAVLASLREVAGRRRRRRHGGGREETAGGSTATDSDTPGGGDAVMTVKDEDAAEESPGEGSDDSGSGGL
jgi:hypothetical protein